MLAPLSNLVGECGHTKVTKAKKTKKVPWYWDEIHQQAFEKVKATIAKDVTLAYPDYSQEFEIHTDSSKFQLGSIITQNNRPLAFFSRKLSPAQQKYSMAKQELLAIVETLKEFNGMLEGQPIRVYTDHKNLMKDDIGLTSDWVYRWRLLFEEY
jgi:hypothetical protein